MEVITAMPRPRSADSIRREIARLNLAAKGDPEDCTCIRCRRLSEAVDESLRARHRVYIAGKEVDRFHSIARDGLGRGAGTHRGHTPRGAASARKGDPSLHDPAGVSRPPSVRGLSSGGSE